MFGGYVGTVEKNLKWLRMTIGTMIYVIKQNVLTVKVEEGKETDLGNNIIQKRSHQMM